MIFLWRRRREKAELEKQAREEQADLRESVQKAELVNIKDIISHHDLGKVPMNLQHKKLFSHRRTSGFQNVRNYSQ